MTDFNEQVIAEFRANKGIVGGHFEGVHVALVHIVGRRSGQERVTPLLYLPDGDAYVLMGSAGGAEKDPLWVGNLEAMSEVTIEVGERTLTTKPTVYREGAEWERLHTAFVEYWPDTREYETRTDRSFPFVRLEPLG